MDFTQAVVNGIPLMLIIVGLVEFAKKFGLEGKMCVALSMVLGLIFGVLYQLSTASIPIDLAGYLSVAIYGLGMGLSASGLYDAVLQRA